MKNLKKMDRLKAFCTTFLVTCLHLYAICATASAGDLGLHRVQNSLPNSTHRGGDGLSQRQLELAVQLAQKDLNVLLEKLLDDPYEDSLFRAGNYTQDDFVAVACDDSTAGPARLAATFILFSERMGGYETIPVGVRAEIYLQALQFHYFNTDEPWGRLWFTDFPGMAGSLIVNLGTDAIPALKKRLEFTDLHPRYDGSVEATQMVMARLRTKDYAAFYISKICNYKLAYCGDLTDRDRSIAKMMRRLKR
jgi:hypothetical protein